MNKIDELIQQYCPEGVEWKTIEEVCKVKTPPAKLKTSDYQERGAFYIIDQGQEQYAGYTDNEKAVLEVGEYILYGDHTCIVKYHKGRFAQGADGLKILTSKTHNPKYVYYALSAYNLTNTEYKRHWTQAKEIEIPLPPLPVQEAIVNILDRFAVYTAELQAELQARQQQYQYYRNLLLSFEDNNTCVLQLQQCVSDDCSMSYGIVQPGDDYCGGVPVIRPVDLSKRIIHVQGIKTIKPELLHSYSRTELKGGELLVCVRGTTGVVSFAGNDLRGGNVSRGIVPLRFNSLVDAHYMYHLFNSDYVRTQIGDKTRGAALQQINVGDLKKISIPVPPITEQKRIASILDRFDTLANDLSQGLPAEIEARQQQYEYYRDQLLTFKRM